eukprot:gene14144-16268_t
MSDMLLQISFNCKYFMPQETIYNHFCEDLEAGHSHFVQLLQADSLNTTEHFHNFYWTAKETKLFYESRPWSPDSNRAYVWNKLYTDHLEGQNIWSICNYNILHQHIQLQEELLVLDLETFATITPNLAQACLAHLVAVLSCQESVHYISIAHSPQLQNFKARSIVQSSRTSQYLVDSPYTKKGLSGRGQIVMVADTGCDIKSCYFADPNCTVLPSTLQQYQSNLTC